jgi:hypothetical protein
VPSTLCNSVWTFSVVSNRFLFSFNFIFGNGINHRVSNQLRTVGGAWQPFYVSPETTGWGRKCETGRCPSEAAKSVLAKVRGDVFARFHAVAAEHRIESGIHSLACWDRCFALTQLLYRWRHHSAIFWIRPRRGVLDLIMLGFSCLTTV